MVCLYCILMVFVVYIHNFKIRFLASQKETVCYTIVYIIYGRSIRDRDSIARNRSAVCELFHYLLRHKWVDVFICEKAGTRGGNGNLASIGGNPEAF